MLASLAPRVARPRSACISATPQGPARSLCPATSRPPGGWSRPRGLYLDCVPEHVDVPTPSARNTSRADSCSEIRTAVLNINRTESHHVVDHSRHPGHRRHLRTRLSGGEAEGAPAGSESACIPGCVKLRSIALETREAAGQACGLTCGFCGGQGRGRTADLPLFRRTLVPTELPGRTFPAARSEPGRRSAPVSRGDAKPYRTGSGPANRAQREALTAAGCVPAASTACRERDRAAWGSPPAVRRRAGSSGQGPLQLVEDPGQGVVALDEEQPGGRDAELGPGTRQVLLGELGGPRDVDGHSARPVRRRIRWCASAARAAFIPAAPCTPPPGWAEAQPR